MECLTGSRHLPMTCPFWVALPSMALNFTGKAVICVIRLVSFHGFSLPHSSKQEPDQQTADWVWPQIAIIYFPVHRPFSQRGPVGTLWGCEGELIRCQGTWMSMQSPGEGQPSRNVTVGNSDRDSRPKSLHWGPFAAHAGVESSRPLGLAQV